MQSSISRQGFFKRILSIALVLFAVGVAIPQQSQAQEASENAQFLALAAAYDKIFEGTDQGEIFLRDFINLAIIASDLAVAGERFVADAAEGGDFFSDIIDQVDHILPGIEVVQDNLPISVARDHIHKAIIHGIDIFFDPPEELVGPFFTEIAQAQMELVTMLLGSLAKALAQKPQGPYAFLEAVSGSGLPPIFQFFNQLKLVGFIYSGRIHNLNDTNNAEMGAMLQGLKERLGIIQLIFSSEGGEDLKAAFNTRTDGEATVLRGDIQTYLLGLLPSESQGTQLETALTNVVNAM